MATRREIKQDALARVAEERALARARRAELQAMTPTARRAAQAEDRAAARSAKRAARLERKASRTTMTRAERREEKRREKVYRKIKHRPRRAIGWGIAVAAVVAIAVLVAPTVSDIRRLTSISIDSSTAAGITARQYGAELAKEIADEGIVLLENDDATLPLAEDTVNVFSFASFNLRLGGGGSGGSDQSQAITLYDALEDQGIAYNTDLYSTMEAAGAEHTDGSSNGLVQIVKGLVFGKKNAEPAPDYLTDRVLADAKAFSDTAMIVIGNDGVEGSDFTVDQLRITDVQRELLDTVTANFDDVVVVVNSGNQMELGFLNDYPEIKSAVWIGTPGPMGAVSLAQVLSGDVNPSGRLTDTYAYDVTSAPSTVNVGDFSYDNVDRGVLEYEEGIYVGYRYYETRYSGDEAGYAKAVQFPFGHGLSYSNFEWTAASPVVGTDEVSIDVTVHNTGDIAGKDVIQAYFSAPYTPGGIEKSAIELAAFEKTTLLAPGQSETVTLTFALRDMASWDAQDRGAYVLEAGSYDIAVGTDVHTPKFTFTTEVPQEIVYHTDPNTGEALQNRFDYANGDLTYLSRDSWDETYPSSDDINRTASAELLKIMNPTFTPATGEAPVYGADSGLQLDDLQGLDYDDPQWEQFLDQLTRDEQVALFSQGAYQTAAVERLGVPSAVLLDGPAGLNFLFGELTAASFPTEVVVASTWNTALAESMGEAIGAEANAYGVQGWYAPGMNLHRSALGGRNFEYFSEDPLVSGKMSAAMVEGAQSKNVLTFMKHFALNEQEINARSGVNVFAVEQAMRELYLRPFEITVKEAAPNGAMSSFINIGGRWAGGNEQLLQEVLRGEWGFRGVVSTDAVLAGFMDPKLAVRYGNDLMLSILPNGVVRSTNSALDADPAGDGDALRNRVHNILYAILQTDLVR